MILEIEGIKIRKKYPAPRKAGSRGKNDGDLSRSVESVRDTDKYKNIKSPKKVVEGLICSRRWRLNHLYWIIDKWGNKVLFKFNPVQKKLYDEFSYWNLVLKARQEGVSTLIDLLALDTGLFTDNMNIIIIADTKDNADELFRTKIKFPYENLPNEIKDARSLTKDQKGSLGFSNGSTITVTCSARSRTCSFLHVSEFSTIAMESPEKAKKIVTGSLPAVHPGSIIFIESTARSSDDYFHDQCKLAEDKMLENKELTKRDFKFHFFPWYVDRDKRIDAKGVVIYSWLQDYFIDIEQKCNVKFDDEQRAWYAKESENLGEDMKKENPSTVEEAFSESLEGTYYQTQFRKIHEENRITKVPHMASYLVDSWWDIGVGDSTAIWFVQAVGREYHLIDYYENSGEGVRHYVDILDEKKREGGWKYGRHIAPHDIEVREWSNDARTRLDIVGDLGINFVVAPKLPIDDGIEAVRQLLSISWFDEENCSVGISHLENYKKEWNAKRGEWSNRPRHDSNCLIGMTQIRTLDGWKSIKSLVGKVFYVWAYNNIQHRLYPAKARRCWKVGTANRLIRVYLDNNKTITCTSEHKFMLRDETWCEAKNLKFLDSLMPFYERHSSRGYIKIDLNDGTLADEHKFVFSVFNECLKDGHIIHHIDSKPSNSNPENLQQLTIAKHCSIHANEPERIAKVKIAWKGGNNDNKKATEHLIQMNKKRGGDNHHTRQEGYWTEERRKKNGEAVVRSYKMSEIIKICPVCDGNFLGNRQRIYCCDKCKIRGNNKHSAEWSVVKHSDGCRLINDNELFISNHKVIKIEKIYRKFNVYDIEVENFENFVAEGVILHNSHSADALRCGAVVIQKRVRSNRAKRKSKQMPASAWT